MSESAVPPTYVYMVNPPARPTEPTNGIATAGMVLGIIAAAFIPVGLLVFPLISLILGLVGLPLSGVGYSRSQKMNRLGVNRAVAGIVLNVIAIGFTILEFVLLFIFIFASASSS